MFCRYLRDLLEKTNTPALTGGEGIKMARGGGGEEFFSSKVTSFEDIVSAILSLIVGKKNLSNGHLQLMVISYGLSKQTSLSIYKHASDE